MSPLSPVASLPAFASAPPRIWVALTPRERQWFLDEPLAHSPLLHRLSFAEVKDLDAAHWVPSLQRWHPQILLTGWSTPPLPEAWLLAPDCPLVYVCHLMGSVRQLVPRSFLTRGGTVSNWGELIGPQVAEHGLLLALAALRNLGAWRTYIIRPLATRHITDLGTRTLFGRRVGIHGFGSVARALLPLLAAFSVKARAFAAGVPPALIQAQGVEAVSSLTALFADSELIFECESLRADTAGVVSAEVLRALPDGAVFVNIARGGLVDEAALRREAATGRIRIALDVVADEPITALSPCLDLPGCIISPHIGGPTFDHYPTCGARALHNLAALLAGQAPPDRLTLAMYDRAT